MEDVKSENDEEITLKFKDMVNMISNVCSNKEDFIKYCKKWLILNFAK